MKKTIERIVKYASQISDPQQIILFGSLANKTNNLYSDLDLLVVSDETHSKKQIIEKIKHYALEFSMTADVLVYSKKQIDSESKKPFSFISSVLKCGKIVYQNNEKKI